MGKSAPGGAGGGRFTGTTINSDLSFSPDPLEVQPRSEAVVDLLFRPVEEGSGEAEAPLLTSYRI